MSLTEFDQELYDRNRRQEGFEDGELAGIEKTKTDNARNLLLLNVLSHEQISKAIGLPLETIEELAAELTAEPVV